MIDRPAVDGADPGAIARAAEVLGPRARPTAPLGPLTTYRVGGPAALLVVADDPGDLRRVAAAREASGLPVLVVGKGSNLLVVDAGFPGIAVVLGEAFSAIEIHGGSVRAGGAAALPVVARRTVAAGLTGFEWAVGVPGSIGGAVRMNAGGHGSDMAATLRGIRVVDLLTGDDEHVPVDALDLGYRHSNLPAHRVVVEAELELAPGDPVAGERTLAEIVRWRREHQPGGHNAGSVFANPPGDHAGRLIDAAGLRGRRRGSASVSTKHANFIQVDDGGRADDVLHLMAEIHHRVRAQAGVDLRPETRIVPPEAWDLALSRVEVES